MKSATEAPCTHVGSSTHGNSIRKPKYSKKNTLNKRCTAVLHKVLVSKLLSRTTKICVYKTEIRLILMYGFEAWKLTVKEENEL